MIDFPTSLRGGGPEPGLRVDNFPDAESAAIAFRHKGISGTLEGSAARW